MQTVVPEVRAGQRLGRYELLIPVANGGMAEVWAARLAGTRGFKKIVAIKTILPMTVKDPRFERMFIAEAKLAAQIHHPNVVETIEFAEHQGKLYLVMEWVEGETLGSIITQANQHGGLPMSVAVNVVGQVCRGLHAAHELCDDEGNPLGLVHRDISPQNLIVSYTGTAKLLDFGVAKTTLRISNLTEAGELKGKFAYMSPEQLNGHVMDRRSDVFSIGVLLYMLTTGRHPFKGENTDETLRNICSARPVAAPASVLPNFPPRLSAVLKKALRKKPEERFASALELVMALEQAHPDCFESSFETKLSSFMRQLFGPRIVERRTQLRLAEEACNKANAERAESTSAPGSGPGVTSEEPAPPPPPQDPRPDLPSPESEPGDPPGASLHASTPPRSRAVWFFAAAAALGIAGITLASRHTVRAPEHGPSRKAAAVSVNAASAANESPKLVSLTSATAPSSAQVTSAAPRAMPPNTPRGAVPARRSPPPARDDSKRSPAPKAPPAATTPPQDSLTPPPAAKSRPLDPWDPSTYGGRF